MRQWVNLYHADPFPDEDLPPALSEEQLLDRYHSHTKNCASCSQALKNLKKIKRIAIALVILTCAIAPLISLFINISPTWTAISLSATLLVSGVTWWQLNKLERKFYQGVETPPRNLSD